MAIKLEAQRQGRELTDDIEVVTRIARNRAELMQRLKEALQAGADDAEVRKLARQACGLEQVQ
jgi:hypothetical protein